MLRRLLPVLFVAVAVSNPAHANLLDTWHGVQARLMDGDMAGTEQAIEAAAHERQLEVAVDLHRDG